MSDEKDKDAPEASEPMGEATAKEPDGKSASARKVEEAAENLSDEFFEDTDDVAEDLSAEDSEALAAAFQSPDGEEATEADGDSEAADTDTEPNDETEIEDAELVESEEATDSTQEDVDADDDAVDEETYENDAEDLDPVADDEPSTDEAVDDHEPLEHEAETVEASPPPQPEQRSGGGFFPGLIGGIVVALLGGGGLFYGAGQGWFGGDTSALEARLTEQAGEISALREALDAATKLNSEQAAALEALQGIDLSPLETTVSGLSETDAALNATDEGLSAEIAALSASLSETRDRLGTLEVQPIPEAELPKEVTEAFERQLQEILSTIEGRFTEMQAGQTELIGALESEIQDRLAELEAAQQQASATEEAALIAANKAAARAAIARVEVALDSGQAFPDQLTTLDERGGIEVPDSLASIASEGTPPLTVLQDEFSIAARQVLSQVARDAGAEGSVGPLSSLLLNAVGARSLEPREGNDPDAILSRAEAALGGGDFDTALAEIATLPEEAQAILAGWVGKADALNAAKKAAAEISSELSNE